jgi:hypothetical protein
MVDVKSGSQMGIFDDCCKPPCSPKLTRTAVWRYSMRGSGWNDANLVIEISVKLSQAR